MPFPTPFPRLRIARLVLRMSLLIATAGAVHAAPETPPGDAVLQLLQERGLLPTSGTVEVSPLVQRMREIGRAHV